LLLDTHVALWAVAKVSGLTSGIQTLIADPDNEVWVSTVSLWEIAIKHVLQRGRASGIPVSASQALELFRDAGYRLLSVSPDHAIAVEALAPLHGDPFDRMLVAQALTEPLRLLTHDSKIASYSDTIVYF